MSRNRTFALVAGLVLSVTSVLVISVAAPASDGAFRGRNGLIVFASSMDFTSKYKVRVVEWVCGL